MKLFGRQWASKRLTHGTLPFINTLILLLSGTTVTWAHHAVLHDDRDGLRNGLWLTVLLGVAFSFVQAYEYSHAAFGFSGSIYGATFFMATGFHGFHVLIRDNLPRGMFGARLQRPL